MKLAIVGSRSYNNYDIFKRCLLNNLDLHSINIDDIDSIVSGGAPGIDILAERFAKEFCKQMVIYRAEWDKYGRKAGPMRNTSIANTCDTMIAFYKKSSVGTFDSIRKANSLNKKLITIDLDKI